MRKSCDKEYLIVVWQLLLLREFIEEGGVNSLEEESLIFSSVRLHLIPIRLDIKFVKFFDRFDVLP